LPFYTTTRVLTTTPECQIVDCDLIWDYSL
jgi:hypothetical protein